MNWLMMQTVDVVFLCSSIVGYLLFSLEHVVEFLKLTRAYLNTMCMKARANPRNAYGRK